MPLNLHLRKLLTSSLPLFFQSKKTEERKSRYLYISGPLGGWSDSGSLLFIFIWEAFRATNSSSKTTVPFSTSREKVNTMHNETSPWLTAELVRFYGASCEARWSPLTQGKFTARSQGQPHVQYLTQSSKTASRHVTDMSHHGIHCIMTPQCKQVPDACSETGISRRT